MDEGSNGYSESFINALIHPLIALRPLRFCGVFIWRSLLFDIFDALHPLGWAASAEPAFDKGIEIAVHDALYIAGFDAGAKVFHHSIGLKDVAANLVAPGNAALLAVKALHLLLLRVKALREK